MARIDPLPEGEWGEELARILNVTPPGADARLGDLNIFATLARNPELFKAWLPYGGYLLTAGTLSGRDRELLILRTALNCKSPYEWGQHVRISLDGGIDRETIDRVATARTQTAGQRGRLHCCVRRTSCTPARRSATRPGGRSPTPTTSGS